MVMKKDRILTSSFRKIKNNFKRFLSLLCMALLGVGFYAGIQAASPDMLDTLDSYLDTQNVYDIEIVSTLGLTENDLEEIRKIEGVDVAQGTYSKDAIMKTDKEEYVVKMIGINENINKVSLIEGNLPNENNEIVVENDFLQENDLKIGDIINFEGDEQEYKIVGTVESPLYFGISRGTTTLGKGQIDYYIYAKEDIFNQEYYNNIYLTVKNANEMTTSENGYEEVVENTINKIEEIQTDREEQRFNEVYGEYIQSLELQNIPVDRESLPSSTWYIFDRTNNQAYSDFIDATEGVSKIGDVFPVIFYIIAILISLISMMRMVEEDRQELGTLKALGFGNFKIILKYIIFSLLATIIGGLIGMAIGFKLLPNIIWEIYTMLFTVPNFVAEFNLEYGLIGLIIGVICICGSSILVACRQLKQMPSVLMRPKSPKMGKKILLEKWKFFWSKLNFSNKIVVRNLFRYKMRAIVTVIGISGCTALILAGFGLKDSISNIVTFQFENVLKYDELISLNSNTDVESLINSLQENEDVVDQVTARMETTRIYNNDKDYEVTLTIANNIDELENVISLNDVDNEYQKIELKDDEVVLSEKLATLLEVEKGDNVTFRNEDGKEYALKVTAIAENYINNYVYMTKDTYENVFSPYETNVIFLKIADLTAEEEDELRKEILNNASVSSIVSSENTVSTVSDMMGSLDAVVVILVVASAILAFVVMYNLSNINISERQREIATLKVLGFYDNEVDNYITKENMILAFFGIILGLIVGVYLSHFIITTCETDTLMFVRQVNPLSFVYSATITIAFTLIVNLINHINLKKINMIDSLKSVE